MVLDELLQEATQISLARGSRAYHTLESKLQAVQAELMYGRPMVEHLDRLGVLTPNFTLNHAIWLTDAEIERLGDRGCSISHNPLSNLKLAQAWRGFAISRMPASTSRSHRRHLDLRPRRHAALARHGGPAPPGRRHGLRNLGDG